MDEYDADACPADLLIGQGRCPPTNTVEILLEEFLNPMGIGHKDINKSSIENKCFVPTWMIVVGDWGNVGRFEFVPQAKPWCLHF